LKVRKANRMPEIIEVDVLVVGGGAAAQRAAIEAHRAGARVALAIKGHLGVIGMRGSGATASGTATDRRSLWPVAESGGVLETAFEDIIQLGLGMADPDLVRIVVDETPITARRGLERLGVPFRGNIPGKSAFGIVPTLAVTIRRIDCQLCENTMIAALLIHDGICVGALGIDELTGRLIAFKSGAVILGTGGAAQLFKHNVHPDCVTGDGYAMGYRSGAELINLEFMQIFLGTAYPTVNNLANWVWAEDSRVYNSRNEEFLEKYLPAGASLAEAKRQARRHSPFSTRDSLSRYLNVALMKEVMAGRGTNHDGIYMDLTSSKIRVPEERGAWLRHRGIEWDIQPLEVLVYLHCFLGGFHIDRNARTNIRGLYAVGECTGGCYGADRHWGNMMSACQVFGARAARHAVNWATGTMQKQSFHDLLEAERERIDFLKATHGRFKPGVIRKELQQASWNHLLALRTEAGLKKLLNTIDELEEEKLGNLSVEGIQELIKALELQNMLLCGKIIGNAALMRTESRGGHYREDYPEQDDANWLKSIIVKNLDGKMMFDTVALHADWRSRPDDMGSEHWG
jgi:succinate dehydrogenase/fumarate reductase flavoprotein subunit